MTRLPIWALVLILMVLAACSDQTPIPAATPASVAATAEPSSIAPSPTNIIPTPRPQATPESTVATATPTPASSTEPATSIPTQQTTTDAPLSAERPVATLAISVAPIPTDIAEYSRSQWNHWTDEDGDCQDARQETLISESLIAVTFESERQCRVETGRWYGAFAGIYVDDPGDLDIDHLVPLKNAHDSGGWAWDPTRKEQYANYLGDADHLIAVTKGANRSKGAKGPEDWRPPDEGYWCQYATDWTEVKMEWGLSMTQKEVEAVIEMLDTCEEPVEVVANRANDASEEDRSEQPAAADATPAPTLVAEPELEEDTTVYGSCEEAVEAGETRAQGSEGEGRGFPREMVPSARDGDGDGVVCER